MIIVSANRTWTRPSGREVRSISGALESAVKPPAATTVTPKVAFRSGSSQHGKHIRASVASKWVAAITYEDPSSSYRER